MDSGSYRSAVHILRRPRGGGGGGDEGETASLIGRRSWRLWLGKAFGRFVSRGRRKTSPCSRMVRKVVWGALENARWRSPSSFSSPSSRFGVRFSKKIDRQVSTYDMKSYSKNFDDGGWRQEEVEFERSFSFRFGQPIGLDFSQI